MEKIKNISLATVLAIVVLCLFFLLYGGRFDFLFYGHTSIWISALTVLIAIPAAIVAFSHFAFRKYEKVNTVFSVIGLLSIIINGPCLAYWLDKHEKEIYKKYGAKTFGIVTQAFNSKGPRMYYGFTVNNISYTSFNVPNPLKRIAGDSVEIIYNSKNPEMNDAIENCKR